MTMEHHERETRKTDDSPNLNQVEGLSSRDEGDITLPLEKSGDPHLQPSRISRLLRSPETPKRILTPDLAKRVNSALVNVPDEFLVRKMLRGRPNSDDETLKKWDELMLSLSPGEKGPLRRAIGEAAIALEKLEYLRRTGERLHITRIQSITVGDLRELYPAIDRRPMPGLGNVWGAFTALAFAREFPQPETTE